MKGVPTLTVHSTHDPSVSYQWALGLAAQIRGSSVLSRIGDGHTSSYTSDCARNATDQFLLTKQSPPALSAPPRLCRSTVRTSIGRGPEGRGGSRNTCRCG